MLLTRQTGKLKGTKTKWPVQKTTTLEQNETRRTTKRNK